MKLECSFDNTAFKTSEDWLDICETLGLEGPSELPDEKGFLWERSDGELSVITCHDPFTGRDRIKALQHRGNRKTGVVGKIGVSAYKISLLLQFVFYVTNMAEHVKDFDAEGRGFI